MTTKQKIAAKPLPSPRAARSRVDGLTQERLAQIAGCSTATVVRSERQGKYPAVRAIRTAYLAALGLADQVAK